MEKFDNQDLDLRKDPWINSILNMPQPIASAIATCGFALMMGILYRADSAERSMRSELYPTKPHKPTPETVYSATPGDYSPENIYRITVRPENEAEWSNLHDSINLATTKQISNWKEIITLWVKGNLPPEQNYVFTIQLYDSKGVPRGEPEIVVITPPKTPAEVSESKGQHIRAVNKAKSDLGGTITAIFAEGPPPEEHTKKLQKPLNIKPQR